jgi:hypothetical protein
MSPLSSRSKNTPRKKTSVKAAPLAACVHVVFFSFDSEDDGDMFL